MSESILNIENLRVVFPTRMGDNITVDGINLTVNKGEIFGIVGESGCGKSMTSLSILRLIAPPGKITEGRIFVDGEDVLQMTEKEMQNKVRGSKVSMIFQEPMTSLNPLFTVGEQIMESLRTHRHMSRKEAREEALQMLKLVGIPMPEKRLDEYPHTLSGGMRQRVMIAIAMSCHPKLLIADEPTTALDVTIQAQILKLMKQLRDQEGTSVLLITHDLGVVANMCDRVAVMYCGKVVEQGPTIELLKDPKHPYTRGLMGSVPSLSDDEKMLYNIPGTVPRIIGGAVGCRFADRCDRCTEICRTVTPPCQQINGEHAVWCHHV